MSIHASPIITEPGTPAAEGVPPAYAAYSLAVLILAYVLAFMDRQGLNLLVGPLKRDFHLSDVQLGLLQGLSFAVVLSVSGLPMGRWVDRGRRTRLLAAAIAVWSLMTAGCGLARGFAGLLLCRAGVGIGEATMTPSAYSLIGDSFTGRRLGLAIGLYSTGPYIGSGLALIVGALLLRRLPPTLVLAGVGPVHGWQVVFLTLGAVGLPVALWIASLREPRRLGVGSQALPSWREAAGYFRANAGALVGVNLAVSLSAMAMQSFSAWGPSLMVRRYHMPIADAGQALGWRTMAFGAAGALAAGMFGDLLRRKGSPVGRLGVLMAAALSATPCAFGAALAPSAPMALGLTGPMIFFLTVAISSGPAALQEVTPNRLRGLQHAIAVLTVNLIALGLGPLLIGVITDLVLRDEERLGQALGAALPVMLVASALAALATLRPYTRSLRQAATMP